MPRVSAPLSFPSALAITPLLLLMACGGGGAKSEAPPAPVADFSLQVSPANVQIPAGGSAYVTVTLSRLNGMTSSVTLTGVGLPAGVFIGGTIPVGASTLQLPLAVDPGVSATVYSGTALRGQAGSLTHDATFGLTVSPALPASHLRVDLVEAAGGRQTGGNLENHGVARELTPAQLVKDANDTTRVRQGFTPAGQPTDH